MSTAIKLDARFVIRGGQPLTGETHISGAKNAAVAVLPAALLCDEPCVIENVPDISDVRLAVRLMREVGAKVRFEGDRVEIDPRTVHSAIPPARLVRKMRASYYLVGALLGKFGEAEVATPGGCPIGVRPIDQHIKGLTALGADVRFEDGTIHASAGKLLGTEIYMDCISVGATINIMLAAARAEGTTIIVNAAKEPHVVDTANFLGAMGCSVKGAGTDTIRIRGTKKLHGCTYAIIPDQIETGTLMIAAAATKGEVVIRGAIPTHMEAVTAKLLEMGVRVEDMDDAIRVHSTGNHRHVNIRTVEYPGFATDLQQPFTSMLCTARGLSVVTENIFEDRMKHVDELRRMGAHIQVEGRSAIIEGVDRLVGARIMATDLRAGVALVIAGMMADGVTEVMNIEHIDRGYEGLEEKLRALGALIERRGG